MKHRKTDRRILYTLSVIKDAFLKLIKQKSYNQITITELCRLADITRSTFYIHYNSITDVLNDVLDDALQLTSNVNTWEMTGSNYSFDYLSQNESLIPACQRIGDSDKYQELLMDPDLSEYIIGRIMSHEYDRVVPSIMKKTGLSKEDAETLFIYTIHGSFAVNRLHHFKKDAKWSHDVQMLNRFSEAGYENAKLNK
ncbi:MAG: TetR/AcrR family transcriptional regulator [Lactobacillus sp.]